MARIPTKGTPVKKPFHNAWINIYPTTLPLSDINFWPDNDRTIFTFDRLKREAGKELKDIDIDVITRFVAKQPIHRLGDLAASIGRNGVQVPLIIRDDGKLLDGNRRFFACHWLRIQSESDGEELPSVLSQIPVNVIRKSDLEPILELKILAEANFLEDLKVAWPHDAQARAVDRYFRQIRKEKNQSVDEAHEVVAEVFGIKKSKVVDLLDTLTLTKKFISEGANESEKIKRRAIVEDKFVYMWEFRNKAMKGRGQIEGADLIEVRDFFFKLMARGRDSTIENIKQIEPMIRAKQDKTAWNMLTKSNGAKLAVVVAAMNEKKEGRLAEDKIRLFSSWLRKVSDLTPLAQNRLKLLAKIAKEKSGE